MGLLLQSIIHPGLETSTWKSDTAKWALWFGAIGGLQLYTGIGVNEDFRVWFDPWVCHAKRHVQKHSKN